VFESFEALGARWVPKEFVLVNVFGSRPRPVADVRLLTALLVAAEAFVAALDLIPPTVVTCSEKRRDEQRDFANEDES